MTFEETAWYDKNGELTFSDVIAIIRRAIWSKRYFSKSVNDNDLLKFTHKEIDTLVYQLAMAA